MLLMVICSFIATAQINYADIYDTHVNTHAARYYPSMLGTSFGTGEVSLLNLYAYGSNTTIPYSSIKNFIFSDQITDSQLKDFVSHAGKKNNFFVGADIQILDVAVKIKKHKTDELFSFEVGERERVMGNVQFNKNLLSTALLGNEQFAGQNVSFSPTRANGIYMHDIYLGASAPIYIEAGGHDLEIRPALRASFLMGVANVYVPKGNASMFTDPEGKFISLNYNYLANTSLPTTSDAFIKALYGMPGKGFGLSGGVGITMDNYLSLDLDVIDGGKMYFNKNLNNYQRNGVYQYNGVDADLFPNGTTDIKFSFNQNFLNPVHTENKYSTPFMPIITFRGEYRLVEGDVRKRDGTEKYFQHHVFLTYVQGTRNLYNATTIPNFSVGYMYSLKNILNVGLSVGFLGYNKLSLGPFISVKGGPFVLSFGSNNLMALIAPGFGTGIDGYINLSFNFGKQTRHQRSIPAVIEKPEDNVTLPPPAKTEIVKDTVVPLAAKRDTVVKKTVDSLSGSRRVLPKDTLPKVAPIIKNTDSAAATLKGDTVKPRATTQPVAEPKPVVEKQSVTETKPQPVPTPKAEPKPAPVVAPIAEAAAGQISYRVQLVATKGAFKDEQKMIRLLGEVSKEELPNGIIRYYGGNAKTMDEAQKLLTIAKNNGYPDCFIATCKDGKRIK